MIMLDTHTLLWAFFKKDNIPDSTQKLIEETEKVYVSIASLWEISIKQSIGKLDIKSSIEEIAGICREEGIEILHIMPKHLDQIKLLPAVHNDPFDRLIISQAMIENLMVISKDHVFGDYDVKLIWD